MVVILTVGMELAGGSLLEFPSDVAADSHSHDVYVVERGSSRVHKFTNDGGFIKSSGHEGSGDGEFAAPHRIDLDSAGNVFVAVTFHDRIQKFTKNGVLLKNWGGHGEGDGQFFTPSGIAVDLVGNVFVSDLHRVQKFTNNGGLF